MHGIFWGLFVAPKIIKSLTTNKLQPVAENVLHFSILHYENGAINASLKLFTCTISQKWQICLSGRRAPASGGQIFKSRYLENH